LFFSVSKHPFSFHAQTLGVSFFGVTFETVFSLIVISILIFLFLCGKPRLRDSSLFQLRSLLKHQNPTIDCGTTLAARDPHTSVNAASETSLMDRNAASI